MVFSDRKDAGVQLAQTLQSYPHDNAIVLALPRGGAPIGFEVAKTLNIPLDILVIRKLGVPGQEELAMGAIGPNNILVFNQEVINVLGISPGAMNTVIEQEKEELDRRMKLFRGNRPFPNLKDKTVILVDDGLATGSTALAAIQTIRSMHPAKIILAVPVCAKNSAHHLRSEVDHLICLEAPEDFMAVGCWYRDFHQISDEEVIHLIQEAAQICLPAAANKPNNV